MTTHFGSGNNRGGGADAAPAQGGESVKADSETEIEDFEMSDSPRKVRVKKYWGELDYFMLLLHGTFLFDRNFIPFYFHIL